MAALTVASPLAVVALVAGGAVGLVALFRPPVALLLLIATGPLESALPVAEGAAITPVKAAGALCFAAFALDALVTQRKLRFDRVHAILGLLLALALVSSLAARSTPDGLSTTIRYASFAGLYFVATQLADRRLTTAIAWVASVSAAVAAALAIANFLNGVRALAAPLNGDPNDLAFVLATTLPLTLWLWRRRGATRVAVAVMAGLLVAGVLLSLSRGALLALGVGGAWHAATVRRHIPVLVAGGALALVIALFAMGSQNPQIQQGLTAKKSIAQENVETRLDAWRAAAELASERPLLGVGPGNFGFYYFEKTGRPPGTFGLRVVHDAYLDVAAELGVSGLVLFLGYLAASFARATVAVRDRLGEPGLAVAMRTSLVVAAVAALTLSEQYYPPFWVLGALATMAWSEGRTPTDAGAVATA
jgi:O-antigen ligase